MADTPGLGPKGFLTRSLSEVRDDFRAAMQARFGGTTLDLSSAGLLSQFADIFANATADLWAVAADLYAGAYPSGASGAQVDQLLALSGLSRSPAAATVTNPSTATDDGGNPLYGLVVYGSSGATLPTGSLIATSAATPIQFATTSAITVLAAQNSQQTIAFTNAPTAGSFVLTLTTAGGEELSTAPVDARADAKATTLLFGPVSDTDDGAYTLVVGGTTIGVDPYADAAALQAILRTVSGLGGTTVTGSRDAGFFVRFDKVAPTFTSSGANGPTAIVGSVQDAIGSLVQADGKHPFGDVVISGAAQSFVVDFGEGTQPDGATSTASRPIAQIKVASSSLTRGSAVTSVIVSMSRFGQPAQGTGTAVCTQTGAIDVLAGQINTLVQPATGITGVTNPLDCISGQDLESDTVAIARLTATDTGQTSATLSSLIARVAAVPDVTQVVAFANSTAASEQTLRFASAPSSGSYALNLAGQTTGPLPYSASAADIQTALRGMQGLDDVSVATSGPTAFLVRFGPKSGHVPHDLLTIPTNSTGVALTADFGCPSHAVELIAEGGDTTAIATAILSALPAGIGSYGRPAATTVAKVLGGSATATVPNPDSIAAGQYILAPDLPDTTTVSSVTGTSLVMSLPANATNASEPMAFGYGAALDDGSGNTVVVRFSRPTPVLVYVQLTIVRDNSIGSAFRVESIAAIAQTLIDTINAVPIGKPVVVTGSNGLLNSFRSVPGILEASLTIGRTPGGTSSDNLAIAPNEAPLATSASVSVSVS